MYINPFTNAGYWNINPQTMAGQSIDYGISTAPQINTANMQQLQALLGAALPGYQGAVSGMQRNNMQLIKGNVPTDVQQEIQRFGAQSTLSSGIGGAGGGITGASAGFANTNKTITARDLGLTSLSLQQTGQTQESNLLQLARSYLMPQPVNPMSILPLNNLIQAQQWQDVAQFQANEAAYTAGSNFASTQAGVPSQGLGGMGGDLTALVAALTKNQTGAGGQNVQGSNLLSQLFGMFNQGGGAGYNIPTSSTPVGTSLGPGD